LNWRVKVEFINFLVDSIILDNERNIFQMEKDLLLNTLLNFINDQSKYVRYAFTLNLSYLFKSLTQSNHVILYQKINQCINHNQTTVEHQISNAYHFYTMAKYSFISRNECLYHLIYLSRNNHIHQLITHLLENLALDLGTKNYQSLLQEHLPSLIYLWIDDDRVKLNEFPFYYYGYNTLTEFYESNYKLFIPNLVLKTQYSEVEYISKLINKPIKDILIFSFAKVMAFTLPLLFQDDANLLDYGKTIYNQYIKLYLPGDQFKNSCKDHIEDIVLELLYLIYDTNLLDYYIDYYQTKCSVPLKKIIVNEDKPLYQNDQSKLKIKFPNYKGITVLKAIDYILNLIDENSLIQFLNKNRLPNLFVFFHEKIETTIYNEERQRLMNIYKYIISLINTLISQPFLHKSIMIRMLKYMENQDLFNICYSIIEYILDNSNVSSEILKESIIQIVSLIFQQINKQSDSNKVKKLQSILLKYVKNEIELYPSFIRNELFKRNINSFMELSDNEEITKSHNLYDIINFNNIDSKFSIMINIHCLEDQLRKKDVLDYLAELDNKKLLIMLFKQIFSWIKHFTVSKELLTCIGLLNSFFDDNIINSIITSIIDEDNSISFDDLSTDTKDTTLCFGHIMLLKYLNRCIYDYNINIVSISISLLQSILKTSIGNYAFNQLQDKYKKNLEIFISPTNTQMISSKLFYFKSIPKDIQEEETWSTSGKTYNEWITEITCTMIMSFYTDEIFDQLIVFIEKCPKFSEQILPYIFYAILLNEHKNDNSMLDESNDASFKQYYYEEQQKLIDNLRHSIKDSACNILSKGVNFILKNYENEDLEALRTILNVLVFLRKQRIPNGMTQFDNNGWLNLNYHYVVKSAIKCNLYVVALLFIEISIDNNKLNNQINNRASSLSSFTRKKRHKIRSQSFNEFSNEERGWYQDLLIDIYQHTDSDDFYALNYDLNKSIKPLLRKYEHEQDWRKQLIFHERFLNVDNQENLSSSHSMNPYLIYSNIAKSLNGLNLYHMSFNIINSLNFMNKNINVDQYHSTNYLFDQNTSLMELQYEAAWKISQWDFEPVINSNLQNHEIPGIHYYIFNCLKYLKKGYKENFNTIIDDAWVYLQTNFIFDKFNIKKNNFLYLQLINEIHEGSEMLEMKSPKYLNIWQTRIDLMKDYEFKTVESILILRTIILKTIIESFTSNQMLIMDNSLLNTHDIFKDFLINNLFLISKMARKTGNIQSSQNSIELLHNVVNEENEVHNLKLYNRLILEEAKILWNQEENSLAINMIRKHINDISSNNLTFSSINNEEYANEKNEILYQLLSHLGNWIGIQRLENPASIIENYMEKAVKIMENGNMKSSEVYFKFADYSNNQYQIMCQPDICVQQKLLSYKEKELEALNISIKNTKSTTERNKFEIQKRRIETQIELDKSEINRVVQTQEIFLIKAIENYLKTLVHSDQYDICVFRLIALWFKNKYNTLINQYIYKYIKIIESRKFLTLIYQLSARMSLANADKKTKYFVLTVNALIQKMIIDHPYHCLYQIIALRNGDILSSSDIQYFSSPEKRKQHLNSGIINKQTMLRIQAASAMLNSVMKHRHLAHLIKEVEFLSEAYIELAALKFSANDRKKLINNKKPIPFGSKLKLSKIKELERVPIATKSLPVDPTCEYKNIVYIQGYKPSFQLIGGINLPKVLECMGNDGKIYKQLVKGSDDLRQDAVLTKIFNLVNVLLKKNQSTRKRQLSIRTYNIIPLSPRSGIIEWVQNTIPFGTYLNEAHPKYIYNISTI